MVFLLAVDLQQMAYSIENKKRNGSNESLILVQ